MKKAWIEWWGIELNVVSPKEKLVALMGGFCGILLLMTVVGSFIGLEGCPALIASMGASAVLLFGVPHGQLSQPWPVLAGHALSALIGVACAKWISIPELAGACAVGLALGAMHQLKCIHPPGGATALTAVIGGPAVHAMGFEFVFLPVILNAALMVGAACCYNYFFRWRRYPVSLAQPVAQPTSRSRAPGHEEIVEAIRSLDSFVDISETDLVQLVTILGHGPEARREKLKEEAHERVMRRRHK